MNKSWIGMVILIISVSMGMGIAISDGYREHESDEKGDERHERHWLGKKMLDPPANKAYVTSCGECHDAYPAQLLPLQSWQRIMKHLDNHFGDNAELDPESFAQVMRYLEQNHAGQQKTWLSRKLTRRLDPSHMPTRITELPGFASIHHEIPAAAVKNNPKVRSFSNCSACHTGMARGSFDEHEVRIPGYGRWDD